MINEIMREYDRDRAASAQLSAKRMAEVYEKNPAIKDIDDSLAGVGISICRAILSGAKEADIRKMAKENQQKQKLRAKLLKDAGFCENYLKDIHKCAKCLDTGSLESGEKCVCFKQKLIAKYYQMSNLGRAISMENFDNFSFDYYSSEKDENVGVSPREKMEIVHKYAKKFVEDFKEGPGNLFFHGKAGLGKTFLCSCIAKDVLDMGHTVLYLPATKLFKAVEDARFNRVDNERSNEQINFFYTAELLIIDDLGTEFPTITTQSALFDIVNSRILDERPTIISSNLSPRELEAHCSDRVVSRLIEHYGFVHFIGEDIRHKKKYS